MDQESAKKNTTPPFRFLKPDEFAALPTEKKLIYLDMAYEALREKMDDTIPPKAQHKMQYPPKSRPRR
jgi:hypothetical protein